MFLGKPTKRGGRSPPQGHLGAPPRPRAPEIGCPPAKKQLRGNGQGTGDRADDRLARLADPVFLPALTDGWWAPSNLLKTTPSIPTSDLAGTQRYGLVLQEERDQFLLVGRGFTTSFTAAQDARVGILSVEELDFDGRWTVTRRLGGDETSSGSSVRLHSLDASQPAFFPIPLPLASTGIVRVRLYTY